MLIIMEREIAIREAKRLGTDITNVVREYWEIILLKEIFDSPFGKDIIFKGGTALRLFYNSPRFSEDIDFSLIRDSLKREFCPLIEKIIRPYPELSITDCADKYYTYLAEIKVVVDYLSSPFRIKIEISKRIQKRYEWELKLLTSPLTNLSVLAQVATLDQLYRDKLECVKDRQKPKDVFDLWFISQRLNKPYNPERISISTKVLIRDLRKFLPKNFWEVIKELKK